MKKFASPFKKLPFRIPMKQLNFVQRFGLYRFKKSFVVAASILVFLILNFLFSYISFRADFSKGNAYTLSDSTREIVRKLDNQVTVTLYASDNIPARLQPLTREVIDLLREYERAGNVVVQISEFNPAEDQDTVTTLQQSGIAGIPIREQQQSEVSVTEIYFGIIVKYQDNQEVVSQALDVENLEYNLTSAIYRLTNEQLPQIATIGSDNSMIPQQDELGVFKQIAGRFFSILPVAPPQETEEATEEEAATLQVDPSTKTLMVFDSPAREFSDEEVAAINEYSKKGNTVVFTNGVVVDDSTLEVATGEAKLQSLLAAKGIAVQQNLVLSGRAEMVNLGGGGYSLLIPYPMWLQTDAFNTDVSYFSGVAGLTFPWVSSLETVDIKGYSVRKIVETSAQSWIQQGTFSTNPQEIPEPTEEELGTFTLAAETTAESKAKTMVIGSSRFIYNQYLSRETQNLEFVLNILSDYASGGALSGISRRSLSIYSLPVLPKSVQEVYKYTNILLFPIIFGGYGLYRLVKRSRETS
ncbi:GldG family protein [Candidatus Roizmanbacteria bacterium]|nr:MAG: GldG family protein [Candidatus Roizmanbacteria bacterium]